MKGCLTIGSRGSDLALWQANHIRDILMAEHGCDARLKIIKTAGDRIDDLSFSKMEGKGFFTREIERELLDGGIDLAVHSLKDLMTTQPSGLKIGAVGYRGDKREMLLARRESFEEGNLLPLRSGSVIGTSSARRQCQIAFHNPALEIRDLRGNVPTRLRKLREGAYDAILIAAAGVSRLDMDVSDLISIYLDPQLFLPAPAQGVLAVQVRENDEKSGQLVSRLGSKEAFKQAKLERGLLGRFGGGCSLPLGVNCQANGDEYILSAVLGIKDGENWAGLKRAAVHGNEPNTLIEMAFLSIERSEVCCA